MPKVTPHISASRKIWALIEMLSARMQYSDDQMAAKAQVCVRTLYNDRQNPEKIPMLRLLRYLSIGLTGNEIVKALELAVAEKEV